MKLISLELHNFRQHLDSKITFSDGVTGIIGPNGSGKSTILEAIAWALYGAPALRGTNDTVRSNTSEGGAKPSVSLIFDLGGTMYKATRNLDASGRSGSAVLEIDGRPLRSGMTEVTVAIAKLLGMDYQAFFTSFFTGQKSLEFMSSLEGKQRAVAISRMLGYDRVTKARDDANKARLALDNEIRGMESGLPDPEELKERKKKVEEALASADAALKDAEVIHKSAQEMVEKLKPLKDASDQKAKRQEEIAHRLDLDRSELARTETRLASVRAEISDLEKKYKEFEEVRVKLAGFKDAGGEYKKLAELAKYEGDRQRMSGQMSALQQDIDRLQSRQKSLSSAQDIQTRAAVALAEAETLLADTDKKIQTARETQVAQINSLNAEIRQLEARRGEVKAKRTQISDAGENGKCPTCERPLSEELPVVLGNFDSQISELAQQIESLKNQKLKCESDSEEINKLQDARKNITAQINELRSEKSKADSKMAELDSTQRDLDAKNKQLSELRSELDKLPVGFDAARFRELEQLKESLQPVRERAAALKAELDRAPKVNNEAVELTSQLDSSGKEIAKAEASLAELAFSPEAHEKLTADFASASEKSGAAILQLERQKGEVKTANAILSQVEKEEASYKNRLQELKQKRWDRLHLQTLVETLDKLRADLNDRIRPELESLASDLLSLMTDGRYNVLEVSESYSAVIRDDGELKPVISGGEDDIVNLALRLAISQMIADRAGQSFSLLILDEVFGSLDETRRNNVVSLLQNLKNRFEQIILITHVESIHDEVDNCLWVEFDEKTKTSRLTDRSEEMDQSAVGAMI